jgi:hypothetical protein
MSLTPLGQLLREKLNVEYRYYNGGNGDLLSYYKSGAKVEYRAANTDGWIFVVEWEDDADNSRVGNERYHFRVALQKETRYAFIYLDGEYLGLCNTEEHHLSTNLVVTTENGRVTNVIYVGP